jgi:hypothetical protein
MTRAEWRGATPRFGIVARASGDQGIGTRLWRMLDLNTRQYPKNLKGSRQG